MIPTLAKVSDRNLFRTIPSQSGKSYQSRLLQISWKLIHLNPSQFEVSIKMIHSNWFGIARNDSEWISILSFHQESLLYRIQKYSQKAVADEHRKWITLKDNLFQYMELKTWAHKILYFYYFTSNIFFWTLMHFN